MFVSEKAVNAAADDLIQEFAIETMAEHGMPFRRSLAIVIAKRAQSAWIEIVHAMK